MVAYISDNVTNCRASLPEIAVASAFVKFWTPCMVSEYSFTYTQDPSSFTQLYGSEGDHQYCYRSHIYLELRTDKCVQSMHSCGGNRTVYRGPRTDASLDTGTQDWIQDSPRTCCAEYDESEVAELQMLEIIWTYSLSRRWLAGWRF